MYRQTLGVIVVSDDLAKGLGWSLQVEQWTVRKFCALPAEEKLVSFELGLMYKLCDAVIVVEDEKCGVDCCKLLGELFKDDLVRNDRVGRINAEKAFVPKSAKLLFISDNYIRENVPVVYLQRVFVVRESENNFKNPLAVLKSFLMDVEYPRKFKKEFLLVPNGHSIEDVPILFISGVEVEFEKSEGRLKVTASSMDFKSIADFEISLREKFSNHIEADYFESVDIFGSVFYSMDNPLKHAVEVIKSCLNTYGPENVFLSFNGGKDCTVLLSLTLAVLRKFYPNFKQRVICWYVRSPDAFPQQDMFIRHCKEYFGLEIITDSANIKTALASVLDKKPQLKACLMGTRRSDPYSLNLDSFQMTDPDWPQIMRVLPLLDWHYSYIWDFLLHFHIPYCSLYDEGYTSLGNVKNTIPNPCLLTYDVAKGREVYLPAYKLVEAGKERSGRL